jgi:hypothetical protein
MTVSINSTNIPATMCNRALSYLYMQSVPLGRNGIGEVITAGGGIVIWTWAQLNQAEITWWLDTILGGALSKEFTGTGIIVLYDDAHIETTFSHGIVLAPKYKGYTGLYYTDVTVQIDSLY